MTRRVLSDGMRGAARYMLTFLKWTLIAVLTGLLCGACGTAFLYGIDFAGASFRACPWLLFLLPLCGLAVAGLYRLAKLPPDIGTNEVLSAVQTGNALPVPLAPVIVLATVLTHLVGGSAGREGAALQLGGTIGSFVGSAVRLDEADRRMAVLCGMSAVFTALFNTPLTATFFVIEVASVGVMQYAALIPCLFSSLTAYALVGRIGPAPEAFLLRHIEPLSFVSTFGVIGLAAVCGVASILFCLLLHKTAKYAKKRFKNPYLRIVVGGGVIIVLTMLFGGTDYNGVGGSVINLALAGSARPTAFLCKALLTAVTLAAGFRGGEIVPSFFVGATLGCVLAPMLGLPSAFGAAIGLIALFCGVTNSPTASLFLAIELFGSDCMVLFGVAVAVSYLVSGRFGIYHSQRLLFSKLTAAPLDAAE